MSDMRKDDTDIQKPAVRKVLPFTEAVRAFIALGST